MNPRPLLLILLLTALTATNAQPPRDGTGPRDRPGRPEQGRPDRERHHSVIERWLNHLEKQDPAEHRRLTELREADPDAFRGEIRRQLAEARESAGVRRGGRGAPPELSREIKALRVARTDADRAEAREALHAALAEHIDQRLAMREQRIQSIREELDRLETRHRADKARRDTWIEETLERLLEE
ncbi:MAG: hypothetical protein JJU05_09615 [Verrucomicrobia bacterium]|nr:hypothetical protein [Verrucomicrobiota bacterium]MCH8525992.1 hypothetical protein [Kiritimatiellia bacterium]